LWWWRWWWWWWAAAVAVVVMVVVVVGCSVCCGSQVVCPSIPDRRLGGRRPITQRHLIATTALSLVRSFAPTWCFARAVD
jgi:hypothetical protein